MDTDALFIYTIYSLEAYPTTEKYLVPSDSDWNIYSWCKKHVSGHNWYTSLLCLYVLTYMYPSFTDIRVNWSTTVVTLVVRVDDWKVGVLIVAADPT